MWFSLLVYVWALSVLFLTCRQIMLYNILHQYKDLQWLLEWNSMRGICQAQQVLDPPQCYVYLDDTSDCYAHAFLEISSCCVPGFWWLFYKMVAYWQRHLFHLLQYNGRYTSSLPTDTLHWCTLYTKLENTASRENLYSYCLAQLLETHFPLDCSNVILKINRFYV